MQMNDKELDAQEKERLENLIMHETKARQQGFRLVAGVDEAGRGPLAGPVVAAACIIPEGLFIAGVNDSKKLTATKRALVFKKLTEHPAIAYGVGIIDAAEIDRLNIYQATIQAMLKAVDLLPKKPDCLLVDGLKLPHPNLPVTSIIGGDRCSYAIAAASIIAKEVRDRLMHDFHNSWPLYGFDRHKGYCTALHVENLTKFGPCPIHRRSFEPLKSQLYAAG